MLSICVGLLEDSWLTLLITKDGTVPAFPNQQAKSLVIQLNSSTKTPNTAQEGSLDNPNVLCSTRDCHPKPTKDFSRQFP